VGKRETDLGWLGVLVLVGCSLPRAVLGPSGPVADGGSFDAAFVEDAGELPDAFSPEDAFAPDTSVAQPDTSLPDAGHETCGDGHLGVAAGEACDDQNTVGNDGCSASCQIEAGFACSGSPSTCTTTCGDGIRAGAEACDGGPGCTACVRDTTQNVTRGGGLALSIPDDGYNGTIASMTCVDVVVVQFPLDHVASVAVGVAMSHTYVGDLTVKLVSPTGTIVTLMSRPGRTEPADDGNGGMGDASDLAVSNPITFVTGAATSAEAMGGTLTGGVVCRDDATCRFAPDHGAAAPGDLTTFDGETAHGTWRFCVGDGAGMDTGSIDRVTLELTLN
jgi:cysteine-rich repeat protein